MSQLSMEAIGAAVAAFLAFVLRAALKFARSPEGRVVLRVLRHAGVRAAARAHDAFMHAVETARLPESDGGLLVTPKERKDAIAFAVRAFSMELDVLGILSQVAEAFGGVEKMQDEIAARVEAELKKRGGLGAQG